jgi:hypothetical protein
VSKTYTILPYPLADPSVWGVVIEQDSTCRKSLDGSLVVVKWEGPVPSVLSGSTVYNHEDTLAIMATPAWSDPDPEEAP